jgi:acyl transferase domain-containing protein
MSGIAIVGIDCAFPGAPGPDGFWELLIRGGETIRPVPAQRWAPEDLPDTVRESARAGINQGSFLDCADAFDHDFFAIPPREAAAMDPHQRLLLQCAWRALEDSGRSPRTSADTCTGVFVGIMGGEWGRLQDGAQITPQFGVGSAAGMTANRISYHLDLTGPSLAVDTACSSSLVAVHLAVNALLAGECDTALAGGANLVLSPTLGLIYSQLGLSAQDGRCKPFSADADGIGRGDGVGLVVLRRLEDALADGQRIYAVISGTAVNQDGRSNGLTAPNRWSQQRVLEAAYRRAGVTPDQISFIEAHGTGTVLGDAIECSALGSVHAVPRAKPCAIGSVKGNIGHTEGAAGIAGLIKVALALHHRIVPASRFTERDNPRLRLAERGLRLLKAPLRLPPGEVLAGVSSFGMGGTNAHAVLAAAPRTLARGSGRRTDLAGVFTVTGDTPEALRRNLLAQADAVAARPRTGAAALCRQSNQVKTGLRHRCAVTARDTVELAAELRRAAADEGGGWSGRRRLSTPVVGFLFTGQGSTFPAMTAGLHRDCDLYRGFLDEADAALAPHVSGSTRDLVLRGDESVKETGPAQIALFAVGYALARTLIRLGVQPAAVLGHSVGEFAAAVVAGALTLQQGAALVAARASLMQQLPDGGGMLAVHAAHEELTGLLRAEPDVCVAAINGPQDTVLSGRVAALAGLELLLVARGVRASWLSVSHAFHSPLIAPMLERFREVVDGIVPAAPGVPVSSTRYGRMLREEPMDADYWVAHATEPVRFADALAALHAEVVPTHLVEIGPRPQLLPLAGRSGLAAGVEFLHPSPGPDATGRDLAELVASLYRAGLDPDWSGLYPPGTASFEKLPPYVFSAEHRFWGIRGGASVRAAADRPAAERNAPEPGPGPGPAAATAEQRADPAGPDQEVLAAVVGAVCDVGGYALDRIGPHSRFYEDLGYDSVMIMQLKDRIEARLPQVAGISIRQMQPALRTVATLASCLAEMTAVRAA